MKPPFLRSAKSLALGAALLATGLSVHSVVDAVGADPLDFAACPERHSPEYYCCKYSEASMEVFTKFHLPAGGAYEKDYRDGWAKSRKINFPYHKFTPPTPSFNYDQPKTICRMHVMVTNYTTGAISEELQCASQNASIVEDSQDAAVYWTYPTNARNNNASFPIGAKCTSLMGPDGRLDAALKAACASSSAAGTPQFTTYSESNALLVYFLYLAVFVLLGLWVAYKSALQSRNQSVNEMEQKLLTEPSTPYKSISNLREGRNSHVRDSDARLQALASESVRQTGFSSSKVGLLVFTYFVLASVALNALIVIVICDYYAKFTPTLFGKRNALVFFLVWIFSAVWLAAVVLVKDDLLNFFRVRTPLDKSAYVHMLKEDDTQVLLADRSGVSALLARVESLFSWRKSRVSGFSKTVTVQQLGSLRIVEFQHLRYVFDDAAQRFVPGAVALGDTHGDILNEAEGLSSAEAERRLHTVGPNAVDVEMPSLAKSVVQEFFTLFYVYQIMCYYVWYYFSYWNLGIVMTVVVVGTAVINIYTKRQMQSSVVTMTRYRTNVDAFRDSEWQTLESPALVPGDLVRVPENWVLPCDLAIVKGSTVCDESMLTGESMPVQKFPISATEAGTQAYEPEGKSKKHTLFSGTRVLSSGRNEEILAVVQTTGAHTTKGQLIQSILFPVPMRFKYDDQLKALIALLLVYSVIACYLGINFLTSNGKLTNKMTAFCYCIFLISAVVSPLLPVVITVGQVNAASRLEKLGIFSLNVQRITLCGKVRVFCFDKTGTLTKQGLDFLGVQPVVNAAFLPLVQDVDKRSSASSLSSSPPSEAVQFALATCHAVGSLDGRLVGNEVEVRMLEATGWKLVEKEGTQPFVQSPDGSVELEFVRRFDFDHHRMSMSVVVRNRATGQLFVFCKGSYERMRQLSVESSVPADYTVVADRHAKDGSYVLGVSFRELPREWTAEQLDAFVANRDAVDSELSLLGLILFRNELKEDTPGAIAQLKDGDIRVVMITGDNAMCGCYIARKSGMISPTSRVILGDMVRTDSSSSIRRLVWRDVDNDSDDGSQYTLPVIKRQLADGEDIELALTGVAFDRLIAISEMKELLLNVRIFSRMTPDGKIECVKLHMDAGAVTGMCGDGGNDCGALRIAHAGVALSDAEASVVSPFTSRPKTIQSVVDICREGRCSVATSFASVKFLIMYGVIASTLRLFQWYHAVIMSEWCFILADGVTLVGLSYVITLSRPLPDLREQRPTSSLVGPTTLVSLVGQELINITFLFNGVHMLINERWYCPFTPDNVDLAKWWLLSDNHMATTLFFTVITQQQLAAWVFSFGSRFRASIWRNYLLVAFYALLVVLDMYLILGEPSKLTDLFRIASGTNVVVLPYIPMPFSFRLKYFALLAGNVATVILFEYVVVLGPVRDLLRKKYHKDHLPMRR